MKYLLTLICLILTGCKSIKPDQISVDIEYGGKIVCINNPPAYDDGIRGYDPTAYFGVIYFEWDY